MRGMDGSMAGGRQRGAHVGPPVGLCWRQLCAPWFTLPLWAARWFASMPALFSDLVCRLRIAACLSLPIRHSFACAAPACLACVLAVRPRYALLPTPHLCCLCVVGAEYERQADVRTLLLTCTCSRPHSRELSFLGQHDKESELNLHDLPSDVWHPAQGVAFCQDELGDTWSSQLRTQKCARERAACWPHLDGQATPFLALQTATAWGPTEAPQQGFSRGTPAGLFYLVLALALMLHRLLHRPCELRGDR